MADMFCPMRRKVSTRNSLKVMVKDDRIFMILYMRHTLLCSTVCMKLYAICSETLFSNAQVAKLFDYMNTRELGCLSSHRTTEKAHL